MSYLEQLDLEKIPKHVAFIMDGNGRWAQEKGEERHFGHESGVLPVKDIVEGAKEIGLANVTFYAFSTENWNRPIAEVNALMELLISTINAESASLQRQNVRLNAIGNLDSLPEKCIQELNEVMTKTATNTACTLTLALSYSARWEITEAVKSIATSYKNKDIQLEDINETLISKTLNSYPLPDPELMIRTSGESRISNFLLWQMAYTEFYFSPKFWPEFRKEDLFEALVKFQQRERRFGLTSDQIQK